MKKHWFSFQGAELTKHRIDDNTVTTMAEEADHEECVNSEMDKLDKRKIRSKEGNKRALGSVKELPRVKYWEDRRVTIYISGEYGLS